MRSFRLAAAPPKPDTEALMAVDGVNYGLRATVAAARTLSNSLGKMSICRFVSGALQDESGRQLMMSRVPFPAMPRAQKTSGLSRSVFIYYQQTTFTNLASLPCAALCCATRESSYILPFVWHIFLLKINDYCQSHRHNPVHNKPIRREQKQRLPFDTSTPPTSSYANNKCSAISLRHWTQGKHFVQVQPVQRLPASFDGHPD